MRIIPTKPEYFDLLELRDNERADLERDPASIDKALSLIGISNSCTLLYNGVVLAIMGYYELWPGVIEVWVLPSKHIPKYARPYLRIVKRYINGISEHCNAHRLQTSAISDALHDRWMSYLGFESEGVMRKYTATGTDYTMWARLKKD